MHLAQQVTISLFSVSCILVMFHQGYCKLPKDEDQILNPSHPALITPGPDIRSLGTVLMSQRALKLFNLANPKSALPVTMPSPLFPPPKHSKGAYPWFPSLFLSADSSCKKGGLWQQTALLLLILISLFYQVLQVLVSSNLILQILLMNDKGKRNVCQLGPV